MTGTNWISTPPDTWVQHIILYFTKWSLINTFMYVLRFYLYLGFSRTICDYEV